ncbi:MAG: ABC transporter ATP-binding protein [Clostridiales bacterium]|nr:ABC transporter ATP-binding protein [Clostridiales bacterium]
METIIQMRDITKRFPGVLANDHINLDLKKGEIHALLGENGAGKSTLMGILFGLYKKDQGSIFLRGKEIDISNPNTANKLGIGMVHQHFKLVENFTVLENIVLGVESVHHGFLEMKKARENVNQLSQLYGLTVDLDAKVEDITVGMQQRTEILKMLYRDNDILILDEPTAILTPQEIDDLIEIMRQLSKEGKSILFISHKLNEIMAVSDRCTVLRKGKSIGTVKVADTTPEILSEMMIGRKVDFSIKKSNLPKGKIIFSAENMIVTDKYTHKQTVNNVSFKVHQNEIVGIAGIDGNGQSELVYAITGIFPPESGTLMFEDQDVSKFSVRARNAKGMGHIPEDRQKYGLILQYTLAINLVLQNYDTPPFCKKGFLKFPEIYNYVDHLIKQYDIRAGNGAFTKVANMSGGNQQKAIIAREIGRGTSFLIAVQPTRGLDVGASEYVHKALLKERENGKGILLVSFELDEIMNLSDRILVFFEGEITAEIDPKKTSERELGLYMTGAKREVS